MSSALSMKKVNISFGDLPASSDVDTTVMISRKKYFKENQSKLAEMLGISVDDETLQAMVKAVGPGSSSTTFVKGRRLTLAAVADKVSRNNHPWSVHTVSDLVSSTVKGDKVRLLFGGVDTSEAAPLASAVAKAFPLYSRKTSAKPKKDDEEEEEETGDDCRTLSVSFLEAESEKILDDQATLQAAAAVSEGVQLAARLVDMTPEELTTDAYAQECRLLAEELGVPMREIVGEELKEKGYGGIYGVGKAATCPPRLIIMEYNPPDTPTENVALVGKGIVYDTGGLSLKPKTGMCGMKGDMGGSAGLLGAFYSAVKLKASQKITLLLCLAENAIGPAAFRNDDILELYSGKTVEVNNCDAEGRLVLGDGVAHATRHIEKLDLVVDMATLTGAQMIATGKKHAGILANKEDLEKRAMAAGLHSGDLVYPLLYAPELLKSEFKSKVADMKNSVKDRGNAQTSCAGHFIESHLDADYEGGWLHVDMAGPAVSAERGTGYGVALILSLLNVPGFK
eukprot:scaffold17681_cov155-Amphora_coffeaeformis.AAC.4